MFAPNGAINLFCDKTRNPHVKIEAASAFPIKKKRILIVKHYMYMQNITPSKIR